MKQTENLKILIKVATALLIMFSLYFLAYQRAAKTSSDGVVTQKRKEKRCVVIDAGHGGGNLRGKQNKGLCETERRLQSLRFLYNRKLRLPGGYLYKFQTICHIG